MKQLLAVLLFTGFLEAKDNLYINPILPGSYPDPSICKVGEEFFIVNSSFEYFQVYLYIRVKILLIGSL